MKVTKLTTSIGTAISALTLVIGLQSVNLSKAVSQTPASKLVDINDFYSEGELIQNGGFEIDPLADPNAPTRPNPNITGWTKSGDPRDTALIVISNYPNTGKQGLSLGGFHDLSYLSQNIPTTPGKFYQLTFYLAVDGVTIPNDEFQVFVGGKIIADLKDVPHQQYKQYQYIFQAQDYSTEIKLGGVNKTAFFYLDNVSVKEALIRLKRW